MELLSFIYYIALFGISVWFVFTWAVSRHLQQQEISAIIQDIEQERLIALTVEVDQNQFFCYNSVSKEFVCQGQSVKEIIEKFKLRYPNKSAAIYDGDETAVRTLKSQLKEYNLLEASTYLI